MLLPLFLKKNYFKEENAFCCRNSDGKYIKWNIQILKLDRSFCGS